MPHGIFYSLASELYVGQYQIQIYGSSESVLGAIQYSGHPENERADYLANKGVPVVA